MSTKNPNPAPILCLGCGYDLRSLPKGKCPECGCEFDPADPETFAGDMREVNPRTMRIIIAASLAWPVAMIILSYAAWCSGYLELGRWPVESLDDPKSMGQPTRSLVHVALLLIFLSPFALLATLVFLFGPAAIIWEKRSFVAAMKVLLIPLTGWFLLGTYLLAGQRHIIGWMLD